MDLINSTMIPIPLKKIAMVVTSGRLSERKVTLMFIKKNSKGDDSKGDDKTEEHLSSADSVIYSELIGNREQFCSIKCT